MENKENFIFPILKTDDIVDYLNHHICKIDKNLIESCDSDCLIEIFIAFMEKLNRFKREKLKIRTEFNKIFSYTGMHEKIISICLLYLNNSNFLKKIIQIVDFTSNDLLSPTIKKTRKILSGLINFHKYFLGEKEKYRGLYNNLNISLNKIKENICFISPILNDLCDKKNKLYLQKQKMLMIEDEIDISKKNKLELKGKIEEKNNLNLKQKDSILEIDEKIKNLRIENETLIEKNKVLKKKIIPSNNFLNTLEEKKSLFSEKNKLKEKLELIKKSKENKLTEYQNFSKNLNEIDDNLEKFDKLIQKFILLKNELKNESDIKINILSNKSEITELKDKIIKNIETKKNYLEEISNENKKYISAKEETLSQIIVDVDNQRVKSQKLSQEINDIDNNIKEISIKFAELMAKDISSLQVSFREYTDEIEKSLESKFKF